MATQTHEMPATLGIESPPYHGLTTGEARYKDEINGLVLEVDSTAKSLGFEERDPYLESVWRLLREMSQISPITATHSMRVGIAAASIASDLGVDLRQAFIAGLLHDAGKLRINRATLEKSDAGLPFDDADRAAMAKHSEYSHDWAKERDIAEPIPAALGAHHEIQLFNPVPRLKGVELSHDALKLRALVSIADNSDSSFRNDGYAGAGENIQSVDKLRSRIIYIFDSDIYKNHPNINVFAEDILQTLLRTREGVLSNVAKFMTRSVTHVPEFAAV